MRVLWFSINAACYSTKITTAHNGGGWVSSLEKIVSGIDDIRLGIAFEYNSPKFKDTIGNVDYYPIRSTSGKFNQIRKYFTISHEEYLIIPECLKSLMILSQTLSNVLVQNGALALWQSILTYRL